MKKTVLILRKYREIRTLQLCGVALTLALIFAVAFCACNSKKEQENYTISQTPCTVTFCEGEKTISGVFEFVSPQEITLTLTCPEEAKNCLVKAKNGELSLDFDGVSCNLESIKKLFGSAKGIETLFEIFSSFGEENQKFAKPRQKITYPFGEAVLSFGENGKLASIRAGVYDFKFTDKDKGA